MNSKTFTVNIAFTISEPLKSDIISFSTELRDKYNSDWWVDDDRYLMHLPVYLFECPERNRDELLKTADKYSKLLKKFSISVKDVFHNGHGLIMIAFSLTPELYNYHVKSLEFFNPIRENCVREKYSDSDYLATLKNEDREKIKTYGHLWVLDKYSPHITISRIPDQILAEKIVKEHKSKFTGVSTTVEKLQIHEAIWGPDGSTKLLFEHQL